VVTRYLILTKVGQSTFALQFLFVFNCISSASLFIASLLLNYFSVVIRHLAMRGEGLASPIKVDVIGEESRVY
jgi:hypothetical protein